MVIVIATTGCISTSSPENSNENARTTISSSSIKYLTISPGSLDTKVDSIQQFTATAFDKNRNYVSGTKITWKVKDITGRAKINSEGVLTAQSVGTVIVMADAEGIPDASLVTIDKNDYIRYYNGNIRYFNNYGDNYDGGVTVTIN